MSSGSFRINTMHVLYYYMVLLSVVVTPITVFGQSVDVNQLNKKEKKAWDKARQLAHHGKVDKSIDAFESLLKKQPGLTEGHLRLASQYFVKHDYIRAEQSFQKAIEIDPDFDPEMYYSLAQAQAILKKYSEAAAALDIYIHTAPEGNIKIGKAKKQKDNLLFTEYAIQHPVPFNPMSAGSGVNTYQNEYSPVLSIDGSRLIFTRNVKPKDAFIGQEDIYVAEFKDGVLMEAVPIKDINTPRNEGAFAISADGRFIVFTACDRKDAFGSCDLYYSMLLDGEWTVPVNMGHTVNSAAWDSHPTLSSDGRMMIFSSRRLGTYGGADLWMTYRDEKNKWVTPVNMGTVLNSEGDDESPFLHPDGQTLYFRSNGRPGMGKFDIYFSRLDVHTGKWSEPVNLGYPINTEGDEGALTLSPDGKRAWYAGDRDAQTGLPLHNLDIFYFDLYEAARPIPTTYVKGYVTDAEDGQPLSAQVSIVDLDTQKEVFLTSTSHDGYFLAALPMGKQYSCTVSAPEYAFYSKHFDLKETFNEYIPYTLNISLIPLKKPALEDTKPAIILHNIFFATGSADLLPASETEIDNIAQLMNENTEMKIMIIGHTDDVGAEDDNQKLSEARAKAVVDALVLKGISLGRLQYEGRGERSPVADNSTEKGRSQNRRTEMVILSN